MTGGNFSLSGNEFIVDYSAASNRTLNTWGALFFGGLNVNDSLEARTLDVLTGASAAATATIGGDYREGYTLSYNNTQYGTLSYDDENDRWTYTYVTEDGHNAYIAAYGAITVRDASGNVLFSFHTEDVRQQAHSTFNISDNSVSINSGTRVFVYGGIARPDDANGIWIHNTYTNVNRNSVVVSVNADLNTARDNWIIGGFAATYASGNYTTAIKFYGAVEYTETQDTAVDGSKTYYVRNNDGSFSAAAALTAFAEGVTYYEYRNVKGLNNSFIQNDAQLIDKSRTVQATRTIYGTVISLFNNHKAGSEIVVENAKVVQAALTDEGSRGIINGGFAYIENRGKETFTINNASFDGFEANSNGIFTAGTTTLKDVTITNTTITGNSRAVYVGGTLNLYGDNRIVNVDILNANGRGMSGAGIYAEGATTFNEGASLLVQGVTYHAYSESEASDNPSYGGGAARFGATTMKAGSSLTIKDTDFSVLWKNNWTTNTSSYMNVYGGALWVGSLTMDGASLSIDNTSTVLSFDVPGAWNTRNVQIYAGALWSNSHVKMIDSDFTITNTYSKAVSLGSTAEVRSAVINYTANSSFLAWNSNVYIKDNLAEVYSVTGNVYGYSSVFGTPDGGRSTLYLMGPNASTWIENNRIEGQTISGTRMIDGTIVEYGNNQSAGYVLLENAVFIAGANSETGRTGRAIILPTPYYTMLYISNSEFRNFNSAWADPYRSGGNNGSAGDAGGVIMSKSAGDNAETAWYYNTETGAFATQTVSATTYTIINSVFENNSGAAEGGAVFLGDAGTITITGNKFINNTARTNWGGALRITGAGTATVSDNVFIGNYAGSSGGAFSYDAKGTLILENNTFIGNYAVNAGAVGIYRATSALVNNNLFVNNYATNDAGTAGTILIQELASAGIFNNTVYASSPNGTGTIYVVTAGTSYKYAFANNIVIGGSGNDLGFAGAVTCTAYGNTFGAVTDATALGYIQANDTNTVGVTAADVFGDNQVTQVGGKYVLPVTASFAAAHTGVLAAADASGNYIYSADNGASWKLMSDGTTAATPATYYTVDATGADRLGAAVVLPGTYNTAADTSAAELVLNLGSLSYQYGALAGTDTLRFTASIGRYVITYTVQAEGFGDGVSTGGYINAGEYAITGAVIDSVTCDGTELTPEQIIALGITVNVAEGAAVGVAKRDIRVRYEDTLSVVGSVDPLFRYSLSSLRAAAGDDLFTFDIFDENGNPLDPFRFDLTEDTFFQEGTDYYTFDAGSGEYVKAEVVPGRRIPAGTYYEKHSNFTTVDAVYAVVMTAAGADAANYSVTFTKTPNNVEGYDGTSDRGTLTTEVPLISLVVTTGDDVTDADDGELSLREALEEVKYSANAEQTVHITFAEGVTEATLDSTVMLSGNAVNIIIDGDLTANDPQASGRLEMKPGASFSGSNLFTVYGRYGAPNPLTIENMDFDMIHGSKRVFLSYGGGFTLADADVYNFKNLDGVIYVRGGDNTLRDVKIYNFSIGTGNDSGHNVMNIAGTGRFTFESTGYGIDAEGNPVYTSSITGGYTDASGNYTAKSVNASALRLGGSAEITITALFDNLEGEAYRTYGYAIRSGNTNFTLQDSYFRNVGGGSTAFQNWQGGALYLDASSMVAHINGTTFDNVHMNKNVNNAWGGAIYFAGKELYIDGSTFKNCYITTNAGETAFGQGSALYVYYGDVSVTNSTFERNGLAPSGSNGGSVIWLRNFKSDGSFSQLAFEGNTFINNYSTCIYGATYNNSASNFDVYVRGNLFMNNLGRSLELTTS